MNTAPARAGAAGERFPSYFIADEVPEWDEAARGVWRLEVGGLVRRPLRLTLDELKGLPRTELRLEHFCVEGWSAVAVRTGVRLSELARLAEVDPNAGYVDFQSFDDDYHESWDIESALHAQTLDRLRPGRPALGPGVRRARARLLAGQARLQVHEVPDAHPVLAAAERRLLERQGLRVVRRRLSP